MLNLTLIQVIAIAAIWAALAATAFGYQTKIDTEVSGGAIAIVSFLVFLVVGAALVGVWYDPTGYALTGYLVVVTLYLAFTRKNSPKILAGMIMIIPTIAVIYHKSGIIGDLTVGLISNIIALALAGITLLIALGSYYKKPKEDDDRYSRRPVGDGNYYSYSSSR